MRPCFTWAARAIRHRRAPTVGVIAAVVALAAWSAWQRWQMLSTSPFPLGVDGYFYPIELRALLAHGRLAYPASPLAFYLLAPFAAVTDPITGAKLGAAVLGAAIAAPAYGVGARFGGSRGAGLLAAVIATTSVGSAYLTVEFVKNSIGLTVALTALWLVLGALDRPGQERIAAAIAGLVAAYATHKMAAAIVGVVAIPAVIAAASRHGALRGRRLFYAIGGLVGLAALVLALGALAPQRLLSAADLALLADLTSATPHWTAPALVVPKGALALGHDALIGGLLAVVVLVASALRPKLASRSTSPPTTAASPAPATPAAPATAASPAPATPASPETTASPAPATPAAPATASPAPATPAAPATTASPAPATPAAPAASTTASPAASTSPRIPAAGWPILMMAIAIGLPFLAVTDPQGLGFRLRLAAFVPAALTAALVARAVLAPYVHRDRLLAALALVLVVARQPGPRLPGVVVTHPALVAAAQALNGHVPAGATLIVPERHIAFLVAWYTGAEVALRPEQVPPARRYRLLPLHFIGDGSALDRALLAARAEPGLEPPLGVHPLHPDGLVLVAEPTWAWIVARLPAGDRARLAAWPTL